MIKGSGRPIQENRIVLIHDVSSMIRKFHLVNGLIESLITTYATDNHSQTRLIQNQECISVSKQTYVWINSVLADGIYLSRNLSSLRYILHVIRFNRYHVYR